MVVSVEIGSVEDPNIVALLRAGHDLMDALIEDRAQRRFSTDALSCSGVHLLVAKIDDVAVGCCAIILKSDYAELKKLYVAPIARGQGVADQLIARSEQIVLENGCGVIMLESASVLNAAHRFYRRHGFSFRSVFGDHKDDLKSIFMGKRI